MLLLVRLVYSAEKVLLAVLIFFVVFSVIERLIIHIVCYTYYKIEVDKINVIAPKKASPAYLF